MRRAILASALAWIGVTPAPAPAEARQTIPLSRDNFQFHPGVDVFQMKVALR